MKLKSIKISIKTKNNIINLAKELDYTTPNYLKLQRILFLEIINCLQKNTILLFKIIEIMQNNIFSYKEQKSPVTINISYSNDDIFNIHKLISKIEKNIKITILGKKQNIKLFSYQIIGLLIFTIKNDNEIKKIIKLNL